MVGSMNRMGIIHVLHRLQDREITTIEAANMITHNSDGSDPMREDADSAYETWDAIYGCAMRCLLGFALGCAFMATIFLAGFTS